MVMKVNSLTPSLAFKGNTGAKRLGIAGTTVAGAALLAGCPSGGEPTPDVTRTDTTTATNTASKTDTLTKTSTATGTDTATSVIKDTTPADKLLNNLLDSGWVDSDTTTLPKNRAWTDDGNAMTVKEVLDEGNSKVAYNGEAMHLETGQISTFTKTYDVVNDELIETRVAVSNGIGNTSKCKIAREDGFIKISTMNGMVDHYEKALGGGKVGLFNLKTDAKPFATLTDVTINGSPLAQLDAVMKKFGGKIKQNIGVAYNTKAEGKPAKGLMQIAAELADFNTIFKKAVLRKLRV